MTELAPRFPLYAFKIKRNDSFKDWPKNMTQKPDEMVESGFFYTGKSDCVLCFYCGGGLKDWEPHDSPFDMHALHYSECYFFKKIKGEEFIENILSRKCEILSTFRSSKDINQKTGICVICLINPYNCICLPCGHLAICTCCSAKNEIKTCPLCRHKLEKKVRVFFA